MSTGDPGACSSSGAWLGSLSRQLETAGRQAESAGPVDRAWTGPAAREATRRHTRLLASTGWAAELVAEIGALLQDHATDLAAAGGDVRRIEERATLEGLAVLDGRVRAAWGISGIADARDDAEREELVGRLQRDLDLGLTQLERRRTRLRQALEAATGSLTDLGADLRSG